MASDDRWGDSEPDEAPEALSVREVARRKVQAPAIALIVLAALSLGLILLGVVQYPTLPAQFAAQREQIDADPNMPDDQKRMTKQILDGYEKFAVTFAPVVWAVAGGVALLTLFAGLKLRNLSGRGLGTAAAVLNMVPIVSGCCCAGLPVGVWVLVVLSRPDVKAGFAAEARRRAPDTLDDAGL